MSGLATLSITGLLKCLDSGSIARLGANPHVDAIRTSVESRDIPAIARWAALLAAGAPSAILSSESYANVLAYLDTVGEWSVQCDPRDDGFLNVTATHKDPVTNESFSVSSTIAADSDAEETFADAAHAALAAHRKLHSPADDVRVSIEARLNG